MGPETWQHYSSKSKQRIPTLWLARRMTNALSNNSTGAAACNRVCVCGIGVKHCGACLYLAPQGECVHGVARVATRNAPRANGTLADERQKGKQRRGFL